MKSLQSILSRLKVVSLLSFLSLSSIQAQDGLLSRFRLPSIGGNASSNKVLDEQELQSQQAEAVALFKNAESYEQSGRTSKARDLFKSIAKSYPNTSVGADAQFKVAQIRDQEGDSKKAFEEYSELITKYRGTTHFKKAIERQFAIAEGLRSSGKKGFMGIGAAVQPTELRGMYEQIAESAPFSQFAPLSLMAIADTHAKAGEKASAIENYQLVVDSYRSTKFASDAQYKIFKLRGEVASNSNSASEDRAQVDAGLNFLSQNPTDPRSTEIKQSLQGIEERELEKTFKTGQFYEKSGKHRAALVYYREVVKKPDSKHYNDAVTRINNLEKVIAGEKIETQKNKPLAALPSLPKIELPKLRIGKNKRNTVEPQPLEPADGADN